MARPIEKNEQRARPRNRMFNGIPVIDTDAEIFVQPNQEDINKAIRGNPQHCAYAECFRRTWNATEVWVFNTVAYVQLLDEDGKPIIKRFAIPKESQAYLHAFDKGEIINPAGFKFVPVCKSHTLDALDSRSQQRNSSLSVKGESLTGTKKEASIKSLDALTRPGMGRVRFVARKK